jgi:hypothetical protein
MSIGIIHIHRVLIMNNQIIKKMENNIINNKFLGTGETLIILAIMNLINIKIGGNYRIITIMNNMDNKGSSKQA